MPPKTQYTKEQIILAAFDIACQDGIDGITIRKVASRLGSSVAPIYVNFQDVDELIQAVVNKTFAVGQEILAEQDTGNPFFDLGAASLRFARDYSQLFRDLTLKTNQYMKNYDQEVAPVVLEHMKKDPQLAGFTDDELMEILLKVRIFQLGLSVMVANDLLPDRFNEDETARLLDSTGTDIINAARVRKSNNSKEIQS
jgi:AcrR family transcriptional regulator